MKRYAKSLVAAVGSAAQLIPTLAVHGTAGHVLAVVVAVATWVTVHVVPNADGVQISPNKA